MNFRILEIIATSGFLTALEYTKFVFGWTPLWSLQCSPDPSARLRDPTSKGGWEGKGRAYRGEDKGGDVPNTNVSRSRNISGGVKF